MNLKYLGDAHDHWKGSVIRLLGRSLNNLRVVPMLTDAEHWTDAHLRTYAKLLRVSLAKILKQNERFRRNSRCAYFRNLPAQGDLFLDPDTGISPNKSSAEKHLTVQDIRNLLSSNPRRILLIYQYAARKRNSVLAKLRNTKHSLVGFGLFAYNAGAVSMVFISGSPRGRLNTVRKRLSSLLGAVARKRIVHAEVSTQI